MSKLIPMEEAARLLGISVDRLTEMRSNNEVFGYRDGSNWKFKLTELERVADELGLKLKSENALDDELDESSGSGFQMTKSSKEMLADNDASSSEIGVGLSGEMDSVEYLEDSSVELFQSPQAQAKDGGTGFSDIDLDADDEGIDLVDSGRLAHGSSKKFRDDGDIVPSDDNVIDDDEELSFGASSIRLASGSSRKLHESFEDSGDVLDDVPDKQKSPSDTGKMLGDDEFLMSEDDLFSDDLAVSDSSSFDGSAELSSDFTDSGDLVLDDSDSSTEIRLEANQSGIDLGANESGILHQDEPLELGGSDIDALELPEDDDMIMLEDAVGPDQATLMQEDEFNLTPLADSFDDDESTGSQVIALEDSEIYADDASGSIIGAEEFEAQPAMLDDSFGGYGAPGMMPGQMMVPAGPAGLPEAPYSIYQVLGLALVASLLVAGGMVAYGVAQNMWMPDDQIIGSSVLNFFLKLSRMNES